MSSELDDLLKSVENTIKQKDLINNKKIIEEQVINFEVGKEYEGFELVQEKFISEIDSKARIFEHKKTGAKLLSLENDDINKTFSISFKTIPEDNKGTAHILEHCVIDGSRKYPVKDVFNELMKGTYSTYMNAITCDKLTTFPVSTINEQELFNMMDVYMDAVFYPKACQNPNIFREEGWRYEFDKDGNLKYNGIVFNEMQSNFDNKQIEKKIFKNTYYEFNSVGIPEEIPDLTYEELIEFHKKNYHPSNSYIYLYGNANIKNQLKFLNEQYLINFDKKEINNKKENIEHIEKNETVVYEYGARDSGDKDKRQFSFNWIINQKKDKEFEETMDFLLEMLFGIEGSIFDQELVDKGICEDVHGQWISINKDMQLFSIIAESVDKRDMQKFKSIFIDSLNKMLSQKIEKEDVLDFIDYRKFLYKKPCSNFGINSNILVVKEWIEGADPTECLEYEKALIKMEKSIDNGSLSKKTKEWLLDNKYCIFGIGKPNCEMQNQREEKIEEKLKKIQNNLTENQKEEIIKQNKQLKEYQTIPNTKENLDKIPRISLQDIDKKAEKYKVMEDPINDGKILFYPSNIKERVDMNFIFDLKGIKQELLPYIYLISNLLNMGLSTKKYSDIEVSYITAENSRNFNYSISTYIDYKNPEICHPKMEIDIVTLKGKTQNILEILNDIINNTAFHKDLNIIKKFIKDDKENFKDYMSSQHSDVAMTQLNMSYSEKSKYENNMFATGYYKVLCEMEKELIKSPGKAVKKLDMVKKMIFNKDSLLINVITDKNTYPYVKRKLGVGLKNVKSIKREEQKYNFKETVKRKGIIMDTGVNYVAQGYDFTKLKHKYTGKMEVLKQIINNYLHQEVRKNGGAYGCGTQLTKNDIQFISVEDPNLEDTLDVYKKIPEYLKNINLSEEDLEKYKMATLKNLDHPTTIFDKNDIAVSCYIRGVNYKDIQKQRDDIFSTTANDIRNFSGLVKDVIHKNCYCVVGNKKQIEKNKNLFDKVIKDITKEQLSEKELSVERVL